MTSATAVQTLDENDNPVVRVVIHTTDVQYRFPLQVKKAKELLEALKYAIAEAENHRL